MSSSSQDFKLPVGRLVQGSLYDPQETDINGNRLTTKTGAQAGQPRVEYYFGVAIPKGAESHWAETAWGQEIWKIGHADFPQHASSPTFSWKVTDGDSTVSKGVTKEGKPTRRPCDREGYPRHWVLNLSSGFAPIIVNADGTKALTQKDMVQPGDFIEVVIVARGNGSPLQPGVFLNHRCVAFAAYGQRINLSGIDPTSYGFGQAPLPAGASLTPLSSTMPPPAVPVAGSVVDTPVAPTPVTPHTAILTPSQPPLPPAAPPAPVAVSAARVMLPAANGISYEQYIATGWSDQQLIQYGMMQP
jgi:hypothetical protein